MAPLRRVDLTKVVFLRLGIYRILSSIVHTFFYIENDAEIFHAHSTWKVAEKGFKDGFYDE